MEDADKNHALFSNTRTMTMRGFRGFQNISKFRGIYGNLVEISADVLLFALDFQKRSTFGLLFGNLVEIMPRGSAFQADTHLYTHRKALLGEHTANKWPVKCFSRSYSPNSSPIFRFR